MCWTGGVARRCCCCMEMGGWGRKSCRPLPGVTGCGGSPRTGPDTGSASACRRARRTRPAGPLVRTADRGAGPAGGACGGAFHRLGDSLVPGQRKSSAGAFADADQSLLSAHAAPMEAGLEAGHRPGGGVAATADAAAHAPGTAARPDPAGGPEPDAAVSAQPSWHGRPCRTRWPLQAQRHIKIGPPLAGVSPPRRGVICRMGRGMRPIREQGAKSGDLPDRAKPDHDVDNPREDGFLPAKQRGDQVELERADQKPVQATDDQQDLRDDVQSMHVRFRGDES
jgi:hypothetical protein